MNFDFLYYYIDLVMLNIIIIIIINIYFVNPSFVCHLIIYTKVLTIHNITINFYRYENICF